MCGIVAYTGKEFATPHLLDGLKKLEYRGYDSAGIAIQGEEFQIHKSTGNISQLESILPEKVIGNCGIAHTRWATHGKPTEDNAHPHLSNSGLFSLVHNGIIENYRELKSELFKNGYTFKSDTDTEVFLNQIDFEYRTTNNILKAIQQTVAKVEGSYAFALVSKFEQGIIYSGRYGSPLIVGTKGTEYFIGSDEIALGSKIDTIYYPEDGDLAILCPKTGITFLNNNGDKKECKNEPVHESAHNNIGKSTFEDFMLKEIFEQSESLTSSFNNPLDENYQATPTDKFKELIKESQRIIILGCGTSWHAALVGKYLIEKLARIPVEVEYASEFRYRNPVIRESDLVISISQSGETADTLAANRLAVENNAKTMGLCNVKHSSLTRETDYTIFLNAGVEIGVASTKAFTNQVSVLSQFALFLAKQNNCTPELEELSKEMKNLPKLIEQLLENVEDIKKLATQYSLANNFLFIGRGINYPIALEGALKLKEISYIHAEGYPGAEMKHGPIALIDWSFPTFAIVTDKVNQSKMISNIQEIQARNGKVIALIRESDTTTDKIANEVIRIPDTLDDLTPVLTTIPLQLFSYYLAKERGCNVDQPRNLAKSVTVE